MISKRDWVFIAVANAVSLAIAGAAAALHLGWSAASASVVLELVMLGVFCFRHSEPLFSRLFVFGLAAGFAELGNDTWLIHRQILVYDPGGPFIIDTPLYMPFSWALIFVTNGTIALWLQQKLGGVKAALAMAAISGLYIPGFEAIAAKADWWYYRDVPMLFGLAPWFVVVGEALLALPLPAMAAAMQKRGYALAAGLGVAEGLIVWGTTALALAVVG
ncbi:MAG: hypothetical protein IPJ65_03865 [Archangiaceae bacterium]|nr:hypothetical protein [Archangiaceae bacterium]